MHSFQCTKCKGDQHVHLSEQLPSIPNSRHVGQASWWPAYKLVTLRLSETSLHHLPHGLSGMLQDLAVSSGSACTSASLEPSYVLRALGVEEDMAHTSLRFGIGRFTTEAEVDRAIALTVQHVSKLREMSPLWEMVQEGIDIKTIQWSQH